MRYQIIRLISQKIENNYLRLAVAMLGIAFHLILMPTYAEAKDPYELMETTLGFKLGVHTFDDVQAKLGKAIALTPKEGSTFKLCYTSGSDKQLKELTVVFEATSQISELLAFTITSEKMIAEDLECTKSPMLSESSVTAGELHLGMTRAQLIKVLGKATEIRGGKLTYVSESKIMMSDKQIRSMEQQWSKQVRKDPYYDLVSIIEIELLGNIVTSIRVIKTETY